ncbi:MAG: JAB domain-containing protein [Actinomycetota bacterium]
MSATHTSIRPRPDDILDSLTTIVSSAEGEIVFVTCVDEHGYAGESEAYASKDQPKSALPLEHVMQFPKEQRSSAIMVTSRAAAPLDSIAPEDLEFTRDFIAAAEAEGIEVLDHVLVRDREHLRLRDHTDLWN